MAVVEQKVEGNGVAATDDALSPIKMTVSGAKDFVAAARRLATGLKGREVDKAIEDLSRAAVQTGSGAFLTVAVGALSLPGCATQVPGPKMKAIKELESSNTDMISACARDLAARSPEDVLSARLRQDGDGKGRGAIADLGVATCAAALDGESAINGIVSAASSTADKRADMQLLLLRKNVVQIAVPIIGSLALAYANVGLGVRQFQGEWKTVTDALQNPEAARDIVNVLVKQGDISVKGGDVTNTLKAGDVTTTLKGGDVTNKLTQDVTNQLTNLVENKPSIIVNACKEAGRCGDPAAVAVSPR